MQMYDNPNNKNNDHYFLTMLWWLLSEYFRVAVTNAVQFIVETRFGFAECFTSYVYCFWKRFKNITPKRNSAWRRPFPRVSFASLSRVKQHAHPFKPGSGRMGAPRVFVRSPKNVSVSVKRFDTLVRASDSVIRSYWIAVSRVIAVTGEVTQTANLQLHEKRIIAFTIYGTQQQSRIYEKEDIWKQSHTWDLWNKEFTRASPHNISKISSLKSYSDLFQSHAL